MSTGNASSEPVCDFGTAQVECQFGAVLGRLDRA